MTRKENVIKVKQFRSSGGTSMSSACAQACINGRFPDPQMSVIITFVGSVQ